MTPKAIRIVGGGLAGLTLGIALRKSGIPVTIVEASRYPRHKVCGEFLSGAGQDVLLELAPRIPEQARPASTAAFFTARSGSPVHFLPRPAWCLSRFELDQRLSDLFRSLGGELLEQTRWTEPYGESIVRATGRRPRSVQKGWRWFGMKIHGHNIRLTADLEMHLVPSGYVGLCRLANSAVNICGLFRSRPGQAIPPNDEHLLLGAEGSLLRARLANATFDNDSACSVAGLNLLPDLSLMSPEFRVGDALSMIPPFTGNGMSFAMESSQLALAPLQAFSGGQIRWDEARREAGCAASRHFAPRLRRSRLMHKLLFTKCLRQFAITAITRSASLTNLMFQATR